MPTLEEIKKRKQYITYANQTEEKYGLPKNLLVGVMGAESNFNPNAVSHVGAKGLMQFMKATAQEYGINPLNPSESINAAGTYLQSSYKKFGNWEDALRSYNMGVGGLQKVKAGKNSNKKKNLDNQRLAVMALKRTQPGIEKIKFSNTYSYSKYGEWSIDAEIIKDGKLYKRKLYKTGTAYGAPLTDSDYNVPTKESVIVVYSNGQQDICLFSNWCSY